MQMGRYENEAAFVYSKVPMHVKLLMTLWTLGNKESFRGIGDRFGMHQGSATKEFLQQFLLIEIFLGNVHFIFLKMADLFRKKSKEFIKWPNRVTFSEIAETFTFPGTIGNT